MSNDYQSYQELKISKEFMNNGYVIKKINQEKSFTWINDKVLNISQKLLKTKKITR